MSWLYAADFVGKTVQLRASGTDVRVLYEGKVIAEHERCWEGCAGEDHALHACYLGGGNQALYNT